MRCIIRLTNPPDAYILTDRDKVLVTFIPADAKVYGDAEQADYAIQHYLPHGAYLIEQAPNPPEVPPIYAGTESFEAIDVGARIAALANDHGSWDSTDRAEEFTGLVDLALALRDYCSEHGLHLSQLTLVAEHSVPEYVDRYNDGCDDPTDRTTVERFLAENENVIEHGGTAFLVVTS